MHQLIRRLVAVLTAGSAALILGGCSLISKKPELREIVQLTGTLTMVSDRQPGSDQTPETPGLTSTVAATETQQPMDQIVTPVVEKPKIIVSPRSLSDVEEVRVVGQGFPAGSEVQLGFGRVNSEFDLTHEIQANQQGAFNTELQIPEFVSPQDRWVVVAAANDLRIKVISEELLFNG